MKDEAPIPAVMQKVMLHKMSLEQWRFFLEALGQVMECGHGEVTLTVKRGIVRRVTPAPSLEMPVDVEVREGWRVFRAGGDG